MKKIYALSRRPFCRGVGLVQFIAGAGALAAGLAWSMPRLDHAAAAVKLTSTANVLLHQLDAMRSVVARSQGRVAACKSDDGVLCAARGGWEQGWIVFEDRNGDGVRGAGEAVLEQVAPLPGEFRLRGELAAGVFSLCSVEAGAAEARQISLAVNGAPHVRRVRVPDCA